jgi:hypothetical protein
MWPGPVSKKFGSTRHENLKDGNKAAIFDTYEQGAAAQFHLWSRNYAGMILSEAIKKWSGHNSSAAYAAFMQKHVGIRMDQVVTKKFLSSPEGLKFMKAQAHWETGKPYPMTDEQWKAGQDMAFGVQPEAKPVPAPAPAPVPTKPAVKSKTIWAQLGAVAAAIGGFATDWKVMAVVAVTALAAFVIWDRMGKPGIRGWFR